MARELVTKEIDGRTYEFEQFGTTQSLKILAQLTKLVGQPLAIIMGGDKAGADAPPASFFERNLSGDVLGKAMEALVERLDETKVVDLVRTLAADKALCDGGKIVFDDHYAGKFMHLVNVLKAALEVQYGNFTGAVAASSRPAVSAPPGGLTRR